MRHLPAHHLSVLAASLVGCGDLFERRGESPQPRCAEHEAPKAAGGQTAFTGKQWGDDALRSDVRKWILKLMDETHQVPATAAKPGGPRGAPGSSAKLSAAQLDEIISTIVHGAERFMPQKLTLSERCALVTVQMSLESAFVVGTSGANPGDGSKRSVNLLQITIPGMWDDIFRQYADIPGLTHYDGSPWSPKDTTTEMIENSIWDGSTSALWCITEQGRRGVPDWFGQESGPLEKTWKNALLAWVLGGPALKSGGDLAGQREAYEVIQRCELEFIGFPASLIDTPF